MLKKIITQNKFNNKNSTVNIELHLCDIVQQYRVADNDQCYVTVRSSKWSVNVREQMILSF